MVSQLAQMAGLISTLCVDGAGQCFLTHHPVEGRPVGVDSPSAGLQNNTQTYQEDTPFFIVLITLNNMAGETSIPKLLNSF